MKGWSCDHCDPRLEWPLQIDDDSAPKHSLNGQSLDMDYKSSGSIDHFLSFPHVWCLSNHCAVLGFYLAVGVIIEWEVISVKMSCQSDQPAVFKWDSNWHSPIPKLTTCPTIDKNIVAKK